MPHYELGSPADPMLGKEVEGYRITGLIGKGGMGVVYTAVHAEIGQRAAVKVLFPEFSTDIDAVSRFVAEARAASKVCHGGLVKIFYSGRLEDGTAYLMMEYLDGESLEERLRRLAKQSQRLELAAVTRIGQQIASALAAVHGEGIVHRDLKPANLILVADSEIDGGERIKVVDFGIAKFDQATTEIGKTTIGRFLGTALYASPEQCQMAGAVGYKADVYSLGVMLYEMLAGRTPFVAEQPGKVIGMHLFMEPRSLWELASDVPASLHRLVHQMLAKDPEKRPSMGEVQLRLATVKPGSPTFLRRLRRSASLTAAAAGIVVLVGGATLWRTAQHRQAARIAPLPSIPRGAALSALPAVVSPPNPATGLSERKVAAPFEAPAPPLLKAEASAVPSLPTTLAQEENSQSPPVGKSRRGKSGHSGSGKSHRQESPTLVSAAPETTQPVTAMPPAAQPLPPVAAAPAPVASSPTTGTAPPKSELQSSPSKSVRADDGILR